MNQKPLPRTYEEIHKQALDRRGRPVKSLSIPTDRLHGVTESDIPY